jgi:quercetin dioxygenase-like cupin family protein
MAELFVQGKFARPVSRAAVAQEWGARGYSCDLFVDPPGREWNGFVHGVDELVTVVDGRLELEVGGATMLAEPGDEVFIPKGVTHSVRNRSARTTRWLYGYG